jgi:PAS domain S-box-containing protein
MTSNIDKNSINAQVQYKMIEKLSLMNERLKKEVLVRKKAERESNYARIRLEAIIENLNSGILVEDENRRITTANQGFCDLFSMPIKYEDLIGLDCSNLAEEFKHLVIDSNKFINKITKINKEQKLVLSDKLEMVDGQILERDYIPLFEDNKFIGQVWQYRDITQLVKQSVLLQRSEEKYRGIIENLKLGILEVDNTDKITKSYEQFCLLSGYSEKELVGKSPTEIFIDEDARRIMNEQNLKRKKGVSSAYEVPLKTKTGEMKWLIISSAPYFDAEGNLLGTIEVYLDITDRKKMESELIDAKNKAEELNKINKLFLANMSHEIRTPMNAIIGMTELLQQTKLAADQFEYLSSVETSSSNLLLLINDVLDFSKIEMGEIILEEIDFDIEKLISNIKNTVSFKAEKNGVEVLLKIDKEVPKYLKGDPNKLNQLLLNLTNNAVKFTKNGIVIITIELIYLKDEIARIKFSIQDEGIGIEKSELKNIFQNFKQGSSSITREYGGTGLGLPISDKIVRIMGGEISVQSVLSKGSLFNFTIDLRSSSKAVRFESKKDLIMDFNNIKILVVEDNEVNMLMISAMLKKWNCQVLKAINGKEAIDILGKENVDLILMDLHMPKMGGMEASEIIRNKLNLNTPIIALTANAIVGEAEKCIKAGMNDFISKPFKQIQLNQKINEWVNSK